VAEVLSGGQPIRVGFLPSRRYDRLQSAGRLALRSIARFCYGAFALHVRRGEELLDGHLDLAVDCGAQALVHRVQCASQLVVKRHG